MRPADILDVVEVSDPRVSPDGRTIAFVVTAPDLDDNAYRSAVWVAGVDDEFPPCPFSDGEERERTPRWSPDGEWIAYVAHPEETGSRLRIAAVDGDAVYELVEWPEDIDELVWTPDGDRLVFTTRARDEERYAPDKDKHRTARRVDRLAYRTDSIGWTIDRPKHLFVVAADGSDAGTPTALTSGPYQDAGVAVSPDGRWVAFSGARTETWDTDLSSHLYRVALDGSSDAPEQLTAGRTTHTSPSWSPDGRHLAFVWGDRHSMMRHGQIGVVDLEPATPTEELLTSDLDLHCAPYLAHARDPLWDGEGALLFQVDEAGDVPIYRTRRDGTSEVVVGGDRQVTGFDQVAGTLAFVASTATHPTELHVRIDGVERRITRFGDAFVKAQRPVAPERFTATSVDGTDVEAWLLRPTGVAGKAPTLLFIHGGPFSQYGNRFFDEFQVAVSAGYAVVYSNPRGSSGYGEAFSRGIRGPKAAEDPGTGWGGADYDDLMAVVDAAVERFDDVIDVDRLGVLGGSYGGFMTSWIIGHTDRFKAACSERACNNLFTFAHTSDIGASFPAGYIGSSHLDDPEEFLRQSPVTYYRDMATPLLILHSENDLRCPIEQAEDLFVRLKMTGRDVEFVRFPGESHELSRTGAPKHRIERLELILDWFARKL